MVVRIEAEGPIATITLDRPEVRNALNRELIERLADALRTADGEREVRAIVLTGADPAFCAGVDLEAVAAGEFDLSDGGPDLPACTPVGG